MRPPRGERRERERASSSFSPRPRHHSLPTDVQPNLAARESYKLEHAQTDSATTSASPKFGQLRGEIPSPVLSKSSDSDGSSIEGPESSRRLLSMSRTFSRPSAPSKLREADIAEEMSTSGQSGFDDLDEDLYDAFLPMDLKPKPAIPGTQSAQSDSISFSDLSDASISKSALEEALLSDYRSRLH